MHIQGIYFTSVCRHDPIWDVCIHIKYTYFISCVQAWPYMYICAHKTRYTSCCCHSKFHQLSSLRSDMWEMG